jgi:hypothetical protein
VSDARRELPPHDWDDEAHRTAIHTAFDLWFDYYWKSVHGSPTRRAHARREAWRWQVELQRLSGEASQRRAASVTMQEVERQCEETFAALGLS